MNENSPYYRFYSDGAPLPRRYTSIPSFIISLAFSIWAMYIYITSYPYAIDEPNPSCKASTSLKLLIALVASDLLQAVLLSITLLSIISNHVSITARTRLRIVSNVAMVLRYCLFAASTALITTVCIMMWSSNCKNSTTKANNTLYNSIYYFLILYLSISTAYSCCSTCLSAAMYSIFNRRKSDIELIPDPDL
ncbi:protein kinase dapk [Acrasis kona]|uniref:Protein kinase dapk n=1 Tax=Acrasis kona TaxID=1008807 RepID=A0AAW2YX36_9EUKA